MKLGLLTNLLIITFLKRCVAKSSSENLLERIIAEVNPRQVVCYADEVKYYYYKFKKNETTLYHKKSTILKDLVNRMPTYTFNFFTKARLQSLKTIDNSYPKTFNASRADTLHVVLLQCELNQWSGKFLRQTLEKIAKGSSVFFRPKLLVILLGPSNKLPSHAADLILLAWQEHRFVDFTIIQTLDLRNGNIFYCNGFLSHLTKKPLNSPAEIFPDKLKDANQQPFYIPLINASSHVMRFELAPNGSVINLQHPSMVLFRMFLNHLNFDLRFDPCLRDEVDCLGYEVRSLINGKASARISLQDVANRSWELEFQLTDSHEFINLVVHVPRQLKPHYQHMFFGIMFQSFCGFFVIVGFSRLMQRVEKIKSHYGKTKTKNWKLGNCLKFIFGIPTKFVPQNWSEKILYFALFIISITVVGDYVMCFTSAKIDMHQVYFDSFEEIDESGLPILSIIPMFGWASNESDVFYRLKNRTIVCRGAFESCIPNEPFIFLGDERQCLKINEHLEERNKSFSLVPSPMVLNGGVKLFEFRKYDPYIIKFNHVMRIYRENGFYAYHEEPQLHWLIDNHHVKSSDSMLLYVLILIFVLGAVVSCMIYVLEIMSHTELEVTKEGGIKEAWPEKDGQFKGMIKEFGKKVATRARFRKALRQVHDEYHMKQLVASLHKEKIVQ